MFFVAETARSRRQVRARSDCAPLQNRTTDDRTRRADGQPSRVFRIQVVSKQRDQTNSEPIVSGQIRAAKSENQRRRRNVP